MSKRTKLYPGQTERGIRDRNIDREKEKRPPELMNRDR